MALDMDLAEHEDFYSLFLLNLAIMGKSQESIGSSLDRWSLSGDSG